MLIATGSPVCSGDENHVQFLETNHGLCDVAQVVFFGGVANIDATVSNGTEVNVSVVLALIAQIRLDLILDGLSWVLFQDDDVKDGLSAEALPDGGLKRLLVYTGLHNRDRRQPVAVIDHRVGLLEDPLGALAAVVEHAEAVVLLHWVHVCVL